MYRQRLLVLLIMISLLSFPLYAFADNTAPESNTGIVAGIGKKGASLVGVATGENISNFGFEIGETTSYGITIKDNSGLAPRPGYYFDSEIGNDGSSDGQLYYPNGIAIDIDGNTYVADTYNSRVVKYDALGNFVSYIGSNAGYGTGYMSQPIAVVVDASGNLFVADNGYGKVIKYGPSGNFLSEFGTYGQDPGKFYGLSSIALDPSGNIYTTENYNHRIQKFDSSGIPILQFGSQGDSDGHFDNPSGIAIDTIGNIYVADTGNNRIQKFDSTGNFIHKFGSYGSREGEFNSPSGIAVDSSGDIFVSDRYNNRVQEFDNANSFVAQWGKIGLDHYGNISGQSSSQKGQFDQPQGIAIDINGNFLVVDRANNRVQKFVKTTLVGEYAISISNLDCGTTYHYRSFATNSGGTTYGEDATFTTEGCSPGPTNLTVTPNALSANLTWEDTTNSNPDYFGIFYRKTTDTTWIYAGKNNRVSLADVLTSLDPDTEYAVRVAAFINSDEQSAYSNTVVFKTNTQEVYQVTNCRQFQAIGVDPVTHEHGDLEGNYVLANNIDCTESASWTWDPIATSDGGEAPVIDVQGFFPILDDVNLESFSGFRGTLDGDGHSISNITQVSSGFTGIFAILQNATIKNINFDNYQASITSMSIYSGGLAAVSSGNTTIDNVTINGDVQTVQNDAGKQPVFDGITGITTSSDGRIFVADRYRQNIQVLNSSFEVEKNINVPSSSYGDRESSPVDVAVDTSGNIYALDHYGNQVDKFDANGTLLDEIGNHNDDGNDLSYANGLTTDSAGNIYVADTHNSRIQKFDSSGNHTMNIGSNGNANGELDNPQGVAVDSSGNIFVADTNNNRIQKFDSDGNYISKFGTSGNDPGQMQYPFKLTIDSTGNIYVVSSQRVQKFDSTGNFILLIPGGNYDNNQLTYPCGVAVTTAGHILITDSYRNMIREYDSSGTQIGSYGDRTKEMSIFGGMIGASGIFDERNGATISNSKVNLNITFDDPGNTVDLVSVAGIVGYGIADIKNSSSSGDIALSGSNGYVVGGLGSMYSGDSSNSFSTSDITIDSPGTALVVGGLFAQVMPLREGSSSSSSEDQGNISNSYYSGNISVPASSGNEEMYVVGGLLGYQIDGSLKNNFSTGTINIIQPVANTGTNNTMEERFVAIGSLAGALGMSTEDISNNHYDAHTSVIDGCVAMIMDPHTEEILELNESNCKAVNIDGTQNDYFKNNNTVHPLSEWDFTSIWHIEQGKLPQLGVLAPVVPDPLLTPDPTPENGNGNVSKQDSLVTITPSELFNPTTKEVAVSDNKNEEIKKAQESTIALPKIPKMSDIANVLGEVEKKSAQNNKAASIATEKSNTFLWSMLGISIISLLAGAYIYFVKRKKEIISQV